MCGIKKWMNQLAIKAYRKIPQQYLMLWKNKVKNLYQKQCVDREQELEIKTNEFIMSQIKIMIISCGICVLSGLILMGNLYYNSHKNISLKRNSFGGGSTQVFLDIKNSEGSTSISLEVAEQEIARKELDERYDAFFVKIGKVMKGNNPSLQAVREPLQLEESIAGFPFHAEYEIENLSYIRYDGTLGEEASSLKQGTLQTKITVIGTYETEVRKKTYRITIVPAKQKKQSMLARIEAAIRKKEKGTRKDTQVIIYGKMGDSVISQSGEKQKPILFFLGTFMIPVGILAHRHSVLKEKAKEAENSARDDFPMIVHLTTLYMGAGLSFARTVSRIREEYRQGILTRGEHYALEQLVQMDTRMKMGMSQKEACRLWGESIQIASYQKLAMLLMQGMSKGNRELKDFLRQMEQEAFQAHVDIVKKRGEEASTKMLLPMAVLMLLVMVIVMFPAMMQFQSY